MDYKIPDDIGIKDGEEGKESNLEEYSSSTGPNEIVEQSETAEEASIDSFSPNELPTETVDRTEKTIDNVVKPYAMQENQEPEEQKRTEPIVNEEEAKENQTLNFDFLPLIVEEVIKADINDSEEEDPKIEPNGMVVDFKEVTVEEENPSPEKKKPSFEITEEEIAFLPIVTGLIEESYEVSTIKDQSGHIALVNEIEVFFEEVQNTSQSSEAKLLTECSEYNRPEILDVAVIYDEITFSSSEETEIETEDQTDPYFPSPLTGSPQEDTMDPKSKATQKPLQSYDDMEPQDEQKFKKIIKDLMGLSDSNLPDEIHEEFKNAPLLKFGDGFLNTEVSETKSEIPEEAETKPHPEVEETIHDGPTLERHTIPKAILSDDFLDDSPLYTENTKESRMLLLDDIAEMGDQREIPLLNELLGNEKYKTDKDQIKRLIEQFSDSDERPEPDTLLKPFNVFEDLFRTCDTEAKLILMDEIVAVGDEAEIDFLEDLLEHEEKEVGKKASRILEELKAKLAISGEKQESKSAPLDHDLPTIADMEVLVEGETLSDYDSIMDEVQIETPEASGIFDLTFELTEPLDKSSEDQPTEKTGTSQSIIGQICTFSNKILDKLNGYGYFKYRFRL